MGFAELFLLAAGLSMDAFAVSVCKGLEMRKINLKTTVLIAVFFGFFQALMPLLGWALCINFKDYIEAFDHWVAFGLLAVIGANMIRESFDKEEKCGCGDGSVKIRELFMLAVATSIDALAVGITFALLPEINIWTAVALIGVTAAVISAAGVMIGHRFGGKNRRKAELAGGIVLVLIGVKVLVEHLAG